MRSGTDDRIIERTSTLPGVVVPYVLTFRNVEPFTRSVAVL